MTIPNSTISTSQNPPDTTSNRSSVPVSLSPRFANSPRGILEQWEAGRRQYVTDCLARDEFPYDGWVKEFPDLAATMDRNKKQ